MYREPHLQKKSDECRDLWWVWKELWDVDKEGKETKKARKNGVNVLQNTVKWLVRKSAQTLGIMVYGVNI